MNTTDLSRLPVYAEAEVVVCGGGTAGAFAAIASAREGRDTLLIEQFGALGGTATVGLTTPLMHSHIDGNPHCSYIYPLLQEKLLQMNGVNPEGNRFDPLLLGVALEQLCVESGVKLLYHTFIPEVVMENDAVSAVVIANKAGLSLVKGKIFIDATGDGDISVRAGAAYNKGNPETGKNQPISLRYIIDNVDFAALGEFFRETAERTGITRNASVGPREDEMYMDCCKSLPPTTLTAVFEEAIANGDLTLEDHLYWQAFGLRGRPGSIAFNCPEFFDRVDGTNPEDLTLAQINGKKAAIRQLAFYKKYFKGFEKAYIAEIAGMVGIRESREIVTDYVLTAEDIWLKRKFDDMFCQCNYPIDIHGVILQNRYLTETPDNERPWYDIPFRSMLVKGVENLFVTGRCMGAEFAAEASSRIQINARSSGEAAGIGAALALRDGVSIHEVNGASVREIMAAKGAEYAK
ncbi:MAG: FAD-dependent oxidoreductase [Oscillospiraceae bacterium]|nr:FAD-dependent oxidoreductase [Oscillospiraceae bacterium]